MGSQTLLLRQDAADRLGVHFAKLERLRHKGHIPEAVQVGRYFLYPSDKIDSIKERLIAQGLIKLQPEPIAA